MVSTVGGDGGAPTSTTTTTTAPAGRATPPRGTTHTHTRTCSSQQPRHHHPVGMLLQSNIHSPLARVTRSLTAHRAGVIIVRYTSRCHVMPQRPPSVVIHPDTNSSVHGCYGNDWYNKGNESIYGAHNASQVHVLGGLDTQG